MNEVVNAFTACTAYIVALMLAIGTTSVSFGHIAALEISVPSVGFGS
jgi:hypothetical protein